MRVQITKFVCTLIVCMWAAAMSVAQHISAPVPKTGSIFGTVLDVTGSTVTGASVTLQGPAPADRRVAVTGQNGFFRFDGVKPATPYRVIVSDRRLANWTSNAVVLKPGQSFILTGIKLRLPTVHLSVNAVLPEQVAREQVHAAEQQRVFGLIPNFYVVYTHDVVPLSSKLKFQLALKTLTDPVTFAGFAINAGIYQATDYPSYSQDAKGFAERLGATFAGGYTNILVGDAVLPSLLHQDPRYFYQGTGTTKSRLWHALSSALITRGDNGRQQFNFSSLGGDLASGAISNAYYPSSDRGPGLVFRSALIGTGGRMIEGVFQEFVLKKITSRHGK
jgi:carboxypeptidase family protein